MPLGTLKTIFPMLEAVPHSIAMGVCSKTILPYCSYRTTPVLEDGIGERVKALRADLSRLRGCDMDLTLDAGCGHAFDKLLLEDEEDYNQRDNG